MIVEPFPPEVACTGLTAPKCEQIDELIRLLVTIRERWGNTAVRYNIQWGGTALWAEDAQKEEIERLKKRVERLKNRVKRLKEKIP